MQLGDEVDTHDLMTAENPMQIEHSVTSALSRLVLWYSHLYNKLVKPVNPLSQQKQAVMGFHRRKTRKGREALVEKGQPILAARDETRLLALRDLESTDPRPVERIVWALFGVDVEVAEVASNRTISGSLWHSGGECIDEMLEIG